MARRRSSRATLATARERSDADRGFGWIRWCDGWCYRRGGRPRHGRRGRQGSRIVGRIIDMTEFDNALALAKTTAGDVPVPPTPSSQRRRGRLCQRRMVGNDDVTQQKDATRERQEAMHEGIRRNATTTTNTTTNRGAMGNDDNTTINDNAMQETATTRWVRGCYDKTRHDETRRDETR